MLVLFISGVIVGGTIALFLSYYHFTRKVLKPFHEKIKELSDQIKKKDLIIERQNQLIDDMKKYVPGQN